MKRVKRLMSYFSQGKSKLSVWHTGLIEKRNDHIYLDSTKVGIKFLQND